MNDVCGTTRDVVFSDVMLRAADSKQDKNALFLLVNVQH